MQVLSKNLGYSQIIKICGILTGKISNDNEDISCFMYAPFVY